MILSVRNLHKTYRGRTGQVEALSDVSLDLAPGEFVAVAGPSGCGKTTLLLCAGALLSPDAGTIAIDGQQPYDLSPEGRARFRATHVGFVFQQFHLVPYLCVLDNVLAAALAGGQNHDSARDKALRLLERLGMKDRLRHVPAELSTGERQRTALARALLNSPSLLLADEPTGNLDGDNADRVLEYLAEFARAGGATLLVTHDARAAGRAQRIIRLESGRRVADGK